MVNCFSYLYPVMFLMRKIVAAIFACGAYVVLRLAGWKHKTVLANAKHVAGAFSRKIPNAFSTVSNAAPDASNATLDAPAVAPVNYDELLFNLTRHVGELLFRFGTFKKLPRDFSAYPCCVDGWTFDIAEGSAPVLEKMRAGGIFLTAHYGNYEVMGPWLCRLAVVQPVPARLVGSRIDPAFSWPLSWWSGGAVCWCFFSVCYSFRACASSAFPASCCFRFCSSLLYDPGAAGGVIICFPA